MPRKASVVEVKRNGGGAFHPFHREESGGKANGSASKAPSSTAVASTSSTVGAAIGGNGGSKEKEEKDGQTQRKQRRCWSQELHKRFLQALQQLGGPDCEYSIFKPSFICFCDFDEIVVFRSELWSLLFQQLRQSKSGSS